MKYPRHLKANYRRNSKCAGAKLADLDWNDWFTGGSDGFTYLVVAHNRTRQPHLVSCKHTDDPGLMCRDGDLFWLVERPPTRR